MTAFVSLPPRAHNAVHGPDGRISMCIYKITNTVTGKQYVGQTTGVARDRWKGHRSLKSGNGVSLIKQAVKKYGKDAFVFEVIDIAETLAQLNHKEVFWITKLNTLSPSGYNIDAGGNGVGKVSDETKEKLRIANKLAYANDPTLKERCLRGLVGRVLTIEERTARSECAKAAHINDPTLGKRKTEHQIGKPRSEETKEKIRKALLGRKHSKERIDAIKRGMGVIE